MTLTRKIKTVETITYRVETQQRDIDGGRCGLVHACMEKVANERALRKIDPGGGDHKVRIDGGSIKFVLGGWRYVAITPKIAKTSLIQYDKERPKRAKAERLGLPFESKVKPHKYRVEAHKTGKVQAMTRERMDQINKARNQRRVEGNPDKPRYDLRYRVEGLGSV